MLTLINDYTRQWILLLIYWRNEKNMWPNLISEASGSLYGKHIAGNISERAQQTEVEWCGRVEKLSLIEMMRCMLKDSGLGYKSQSLALIF